MGLFDFFRKKTESIASSIAYGTGRRIAGRPAEDLFNSALWSCVINLSRLYATLPWHPYKIDSNGNRTIEKGSILSELLKKPNAYMTSYDFRFCMGFNFEMHGEAPAIIQRSRAGLPIALWPVSPHSLVASEENGILYYTLAVNGERYLASDVLLIRNTPVGYGSGAVLDPIYFAHSDVELAQKCKDMQAEYYEGASIVGNNISVPASFDKEKKDELKKMFDAARGFRNYVMDERIKITPIQVQNADIAKLSEAQKWSAQEVARRFNVPPFFIGDTTGTYNNSEQQGMQMVTYCLNPRVTAWEAALNNALCRQNEYIKFSLEGLLRGDHATRASFYHQAIMDGWYSINEVRQKEEMPGIGADGDVHFFPMNYGNLHDVVTGKYANGTNGMGSLWNLPAEEGHILTAEPDDLAESRARIKAEKRKHDLLFVEEAQKPAKSNRAKLEKLIRTQLKDSIAEIRRLIATGAPADSVINDFSAWLDDKAREMSPLYKAIYVDVLKKMTLYYYASLSHIDEGIGEMINVLKERGMFDDTEIIFTSDHGDYMGYHHMALKQNHMYEPLMRIPLLIKHPNQTIPERNECHSDNTQIAAAILSSQGLAYPACMNDTPLDADSEYLYGLYRHMHDGRQEDAYMIRDGHFKLLVTDSVHDIALFDLANDPFELNDIAMKPEHKDRIQDMLIRLFDHFAFQRTQMNVYEPAAAVSCKCKACTDEQRTVLREYFRNRFSQR